MDLESNNTIFMAQKQYNTNANETLWQLELHVYQEKKRKEIVQETMSPR